MPMIVLPWKQLARVVGWWGVWVVGVCCL